MSASHRFFVESQVSETCGVDLLIKKSIKEEVNNIVEEIKFRFPRLKKEKEADADIFELAHAVIAFEMVGQELLDNLDENMRISRQEKSETIKSLETELPYTQKILSDKKSNFLKMAWNKLEKSGVKKSILQNKLELSLQVNEKIRKIEEDLLSKMKISSRLEFPETFISSIKQAAKAKYLYDATHEQWQSAKNGRGKEILSLKLHLQQVNCNSAMEHLRMQCEMIGNRKRSGSDTSSEGDEDRVVIPGKDEIASYDTDRESSKNSNSESSSDSRSTPTP